MSCPERETALNDYVDGLLAESDRREVERHLDACRDCRLEAEELAGLVRAASTLGGIPPGRELLGGARATSGRRPARRRLLAIAAGLLVLILGSAAGVRWLGPTKPAEVAGLGNLLGEYRNAEQQYLEASRRLLEALESRRDTLSPETIVAFEDSLRVIDAAIAEVQATMQADQPDLAQVQLLTTLYHKKLQVLWKVSRLSS